MLRAIPNVGILLSPMIVNEAVLSSCMEGYDATLEEILKQDVGIPSQYIIELFFRYLSISDWTKLKRIIVDSRLTEPNFEVIKNIYSFWGNKHIKNHQP